MEELGASATQPPHPTRVLLGASSTQRQEQLNTNYPNESAGEANSQNEIIKLKLENHALIQLLKEKYKKRNHAIPETTSETSFTRRVDAAATT